MVLPASFGLRSPGSDVEQLAEVEFVKEREALMASLPNGVASATLRLLVAVCALLTRADHRTLGPVLWSQFLDEADPHIVAPVSEYNHCSKYVVQCLLCRPASY